MRSLALANGIDRHLFTLDSDFTGKLDRTSPHKAFTVTVTPEPSAGMNAPTHKAVFTSDVKRTD